MTCLLLHPQNKTTLQPYSLNFEEELLQLWLKASIQSHSFIPEQYWKQELDTVRNHYLPKSETWLAVENNVLTGFISLLENQVGGLFVLPEYQGKGIGTLLLNHAQRLRKAPLELEVYEKNLQARRFYQHYGFVFQDARLEEATNETLLRLQYLN